MNCDGSRELANSHSTDTAEFGSRELANSHSTDTAEFGSRELANSHSTDTAEFGSRELANSHSTDTAEFGSRELANSHSTDTAEFGSRLVYAQSQDESCGGPVMTTTCGTRLEPYGREQQYQHAHNLGFNVRAVANAG